MRHILVIDDDELVRTTVKAILERHRFSVTLATDGSSGLAAAAQDECDLVIVDIFMPRMDGFESIKALRRLKPSLPILVASGYPAGASAMAGSPNFLRMALELGACRSIAKPFRPKELVAAVEECLAGLPHGAFRPALLGTGGR